MDSKIFFVIVLLTIVLLYFSTISPEGSFMDKLTNKISAISALYIGIGIYITYQIFNSSKEQMARETTLKIIERSFLGNLSLIYDNYDKCPQFCSSLFFSWQLPKIPQPTQQEDNFQLVMKIASNIFQAFEDILTVIDTDKTGLYVWIANFMPWCQSQKLQEIWFLLYPNYSLRTIDFVNFMFKNCLGFEPKDSQEYQKKSFDLSNSEELKNILLE